MTSPKEDAKDVCRPSGVLPVIFIVFLVGFLAGHFLGGAREYYRMTQALERNFAEHCVGTTEIHWKGECPGVKP